MYKTNVYKTAEDFRKHRHLLRLSKMSHSTVLSFVLLICIIQGSYARLVHIINRRNTQERPGSTTDTSSCNTVTTVPSSLRSSTNMPPAGLDNFYQKYTEAYGIPVISSNNVADDALKRACYVTKFLMADNYDVRNSFYKKSGRIAIMADTEVTTDIPEHSDLGSEWDIYRGLGATVDRPATSGAEENLMCLGYPTDTYWAEDILVHESAHGIHLLGAWFAIPGWPDRLQYAYDHAVSTGLWTNTYADDNTGEYFAEGVQTFFSCNQGTPDAYHNGKNSRAELEAYDPDLFNVILEVFPCNNTYVQRCPSSSLTEALSQSINMNCIGPQYEVTTSACQDNSQWCSDWANSGECDSNPGYMLENCKLSCNACSGPSTASTCQDDNQWCPDWAAIGDCDSNQGYMLVNCKLSCNVCSGPSTASSCQDDNEWCPDWAAIGDCDTNPGYMLVNCKLSCNVCSR